SAARIWRRVPSGLRVVHAAFNPTLTSSMNLRDSTPLVHGFVVIVTQVSDQAGSHSRRRASAGAQGPDAGRSSTTDVLSGSLVSMTRVSFRSGQVLTVPGGVLGHLHGICLTHATTVALRF